MHRVGGPGRLVKQMDQRSPCKLDVVEAEDGDVCPAESLWIAQLFSLGGRRLLQGGQLRAQETMVTASRAFDIMLRMAH
jgi:hypothetical protein